MVWCFFVSLPLQMLDEMGVSHAGAGRLQDARRAAVVRKAVVREAAYALWWHDGSITHNAPRSSSWVWVSLAKSVPESCIPHACVKRGAWSVQTFGCQCPFLLCVHCNYSYSSGSAQCLSFLNLFALLVLLPGVCTANFVTRLWVHVCVFVLT